MATTPDIRLVKADFPPTFLYGYVPSKAVTVTFLVLFSLSTATHTVQAIYTRRWWLLPTVCVCGAVEIAGWSGRFWSHVAPSNYSAYLFQICSLILAPTFMLAANFIIFGQIVNRLGASYSRLSPHAYAIFFLSCDLISLVVQATGGGLAAVYILSNPAPGGHVMLGGIAFQLLMIIVYTLFSLEFFIRYFRNKPFDRTKGKGPYASTNPMSPKVRIMSIGLAFSTTCLFIRAVYRVIELSGGWHGRVIHTEVYFNILDGTMVTFAIYTLNIIHPGFFLS